MVKTLCLQCRGHTLILVQGIKVPYDPWQSQKKKKKLGQIEKICIQFLLRSSILGFVEKSRFSWSLHRMKTGLCFSLWPPCEALICGEISLRRELLTLFLLECQAGGSWGGGRTWLGPGHQPQTGAADGAWDSLVREAQNPGRGGAR